MVDYKKKVKFIGIGLAVVLLIGTAAALVAAWGPDWFDQEEEPAEVINAEALLLVSSGESVNSQGIESLEAFIQDADKPIFIDFWAAWCGPCKEAAPFVEQLATEYEGEAYIVKLNIDEQPALAQAFQIQSIPTFMVIKDGQIVDGAMGYAEQLQDPLREMIDNYLSA
jgi:thioredoxin 1